jgi:hypothetical protein
MQEINLIKSISSLYLTFIIFFTVTNPCQAQSQSKFWTGNGGRGINVTVSEISGRGLLVQEQSILYLIQGTIIGIFQRYSAMTVFDRQNLENILREQNLSLSGVFSDNDFIRIGQLTNARFIVFGSLTRTPTGYTLELAVSDVETGERKASYLPRQVSMLALENHSAIRGASADLLMQLGVNLTADALQELERTEDSTRIQYENAVARGIAANRQGTMVEALTYYFEAAIFNPTVMSEAMSRISTVSAAVAGGNLGHAARSRQQEHDEWKAFINVAGIFYASHLPYEFIYNTNVRQVAGSHDFNQRTANYSIDISLIPTDAWRTINDLRQGLNTSRRNDNWNFNLNQIGPREIVVIIDLFNENNISLAATSLSFNTTFNSSQPTPSRVNRTLTFFNVNIDNLTDQLHIRVRSINEIPAKSAGETGFIQISTLSDYDRRIGAIRAEIRARREQEDRELARILSHFHSVGFSIGTAFSPPWFIGTIHGTIAPFRYSFFEFGIDLGLVSGDEEVGYYSLYPFVRYAMFMPFRNAGGWYIGGGGGYLHAIYKIYEQDIPVKLFALDLVTGFIILDMINISWSVRTDFQTVGNKFSVGYVKRFY